MNAYRIPEVLGIIGNIIPASPPSMTSNEMIKIVMWYASIASSRTLYIRLKPLANDLATAATTVTYLVEFLHLGATPDQ